MINAAGGYRVSPADMAVQVNPKKETTPAGVLASPFAAISGSPAVPPQSKGLLSSINITEILKLNSEPPIDLSTLKTGLGSREFLGEAIKRSKAAYAAGSAEASNSLADKFTQKDVDTVKAMTGWNVVATNGMTFVVDDNGNPPPEDIARQVQTIVGQIEGDRGNGMLSGEITPAYLKDIFNRYSADKRPLPESWLDKAFDFLGGSVGKDAPASSMAAPSGSSASAT